MGRRGRWPVDCPFPPSPITKTGTPARCRGCHLWNLETQTVFGEGSRSATVMLVGEQAGDQEDRAGHPFVDPSGKLLDTALEHTASVLPATSFAA